MIPPPANRRAAFFNRLGCVGWLFVIAGLLVVVYAAGIAIMPWAVHMGGKLTPLMRWSGYAESATPSGMPVVVALTVGPPLQFRRTSCTTCGNLAGSGEVCTPSEDIKLKSVVGRIHAYLTTEGSTMTLELYGGSGAAKQLTLDLQGTWHGDSFVAHDLNDLYEHFTADGHFHANYTAPTTPQQTSLQIKGGDSGFSAACRRIMKG
ncbi:MAG: hypothetical protein ACYDCQ_16115 [Dehalococcoidia bacterium]